MQLGILWKRWFFKTFVSDQQLEVSYLRIYGTLYLFIYFIYLLCFPCANAFLGFALCIIYAHFLCKYRERDGLNILCVWWGGGIEHVATIFPTVDQKVLTNILSWPNWNSAIRLWLSLKQNFWFNLLCTTCQLSKTWSVFLETT